jgi:hypothetical protein
MEDDLVPLPPSIAEPETPLTFRERLLVKSVDAFYEKPKNFQRLKQVLQHCRPSNIPKPGQISLRMLDFLCSTYAAENTVVLKPKKLHVPLNLKNVYSDGLSAYGKIYYDCFKRNNRFQYKKHGQQIETTVGQLLYFKDALSYGILDYAEQHQQQLKRAMKRQSKLIKKNRGVIKANPVLRKKKKTMAMIELNPRVFF